MTEIELPQGWTAVTLGALSHPETSICYGVVQPGDEAPGGVPLVRVCDLREQGIDVANLRTITKQVDAEYERSRVLPGDVLVSVVGTIGRTAVVPEVLQGANVARAVARIRPLPAALPQWVEAALSSDIIQVQLQREAREVARKTLNISTLESIVVPLPPLGEQHRVIAKLKELTGRSRRAKEALDAVPPLLDQFRQFILTAAFSGDRHCPACCGN